MAWYHRLLNLVRSDRLSDEIERELEFHIAERTDELRAGGLPADEALYEARRRFGNRGLQQERMREVDIARWLDGLARDLKYAWRSLRRTALVSTFVVITFSLGIGANAAIFSVVSSVLLRPLPYAQPARLVTIGERQSDGSAGNVGYATFVDWRERSRSFEEMALVRS